MKRLLALLLALVMLICMFSACATNNGSNNDAASNNTEDKSDDSSGNTSEGTEDQPIEYENKTIEWMGSEGNQSKYTFEGQGENFNSYKSMTQLMLDQYNLVQKVTVIQSDSYSTTLNSYLAANTLPDCFSNIFDTATFVGAVNNGKLADMDEVLEYSDGTAYDVYHDEDKNLREKAMLMYEDHWYSWSVSNDHGTMLDFGDDVWGDLHAPVQACAGLYTTNIRQDWLDKCGLTVPQNLDEFEQALIAFQENDVNGNGTKDERYFGGLGSAYVTQGIGSYFGLNYARFIDNAFTGEIECPELMPGYEYFVEYMAKLYNDGTVLVEGTHPWVFGSAVSGNYVSAHWLIANSLQSTDTGDENSYYTPMPVIQAVEGILPLVVAQETVACNGKISYSSDVDLDAAARLCDFYNGKDFYFYHYYGVEGKAWDYTADGEGIVLYNDCADEDKAFIGMFGTGYIAVCNGHIYDPNKVLYESIDEALDAGEPYTYLFTTKEEYIKTNGYENPMEKAMELISDCGVGNYQPANYYSFTSLPTLEEADVYGTYENDLVTYLNEMTTGLITGTYSIDQLDDMRQTLFDNMHLQEYMDAKQSAVNRYREAMGLDVIGVN